MLPVDVTGRAELVSDAWIDAARRYLEDAVATEPALRSGSWSVCETFTDAPPALGLPGDVAVWHLRIDDGVVTVGRGELPDADLRVRGDYQAVLTMSDRVRGGSRRRRACPSRARAPPRTRRGRDGGWAAG
jgi:hypothetical protein